MGVDVTSDGKMNEEVNHRIGEAKKVSGGLQNCGRQVCFRRSKSGTVRGDSRAWSVVRV